MLKDLVTKKRWTSKIVRTRVTTLSVGNSKSFETMFIKFLSLSTNKFTINLSFSSRSVRRSRLFKSWKSLETEVRTLRPTNVILLTAVPGETECRHSGGRYVVGRPTEVSVGLLGLTMTFVTTHPTQRRPPPDRGLLLGRLDGSHRRQVSGCRSLNSCVGRSPTRTCSGGGEVAGW